MQQAGLAGNLDPRLADAAGRDHVARRVEQRDLAELADLEDVVLEHAVLLGLGEAGVLEVGGEHLQQVGVGDDVAANFLGGAGRDVLIALDDRLACPALEGEEGDEAVGEQGDHRRDRQEQRELDGDPTDAQAHRWLLQFRPTDCRSLAGRQDRSVVRMSRPGSAATSKRRFTARERSLHARKSPGGLSTTAF